MESINISNNDNKYEGYYLQFNDKIKIPLSNFTILVKSSLLLQSFFDDEDVYSGSNIIDRNIPILCPSTCVTGATFCESGTYVLDENNECYFNNKKDLLFMFTYSYNKFLDICNFLDIIAYENKDKEFSTQFIMYVMNNTKNNDCYIPDTGYFMQSEIKSIINYYNDIDINMQIRTCTPEFYFLYLTVYKEEVIKHNRYDIYSLSLKKSCYYEFLFKYNNATTNQINQELMQFMDIKVGNNFVDIKIKKGFDIDGYTLRNPLDCGIAVYNAKQNKYIEKFELSKYIYCLHYDIPFTLSESVI